MKTIVQNEAHRRLIEETRYRSAAVAPLVARGSAIGALSLLHANTDLRYEEGDMELLGELAGPRRDRPRQRPALRGA
jgi:GAF domain-containing protein